MELKLFIFTRVLQRMATVEGTAKPDEIVTWVEDAYEDWLAIEAEIKSYAEEVA